MRSCSRCAGVTEEDCDEDERNRKRNGDGKLAPPWQSRMPDRPDQNERRERDDPDTVADQPGPPGEPEITPLEDLRNQHRAGCPGGADDAADRCEDDELDRPVWVQQPGGSAAIAPEQKCAGNSFERCRRADAEREEAWFKR